MYCESEVAQRSSVKRIHPHCALPLKVQKDIYEIVSSVADTPALSSFALVLAI